MGAGASITTIESMKKEIEKLPESFNAEKAKEILGSNFDQSIFDQLMANELVQKSDLVVYYDNLHKSATATPAAATPTPAPAPAPAAAVDATAPAAKAATSASAASAEDVSSNDLVMVPKSVFEAQFPGFGKRNHKVASMSASETLDMSAKDLELIPAFVSDAKNLKNLDLSKNNIFRLTSDFWERPLCEINLSYNNPLGKNLVSILKAASACTTLNKFLLRGMRTEGDALWDIEELCTSLKALKNLEHLDMTDNSLPESYRTGLKERLAFIKTLHV